MSRPQLILVVASVMLGMLLAALDQTIVGTAMPRLIAQLNGLEHYAWVATAYLLASTVMVPIFGKLSDIYGRKPFFLLGLLLFLLGSALSGASQTMTQLIVFRAIQGLGRRDDANRPGHYRRHLPAGRARQVARTADGRLRPLLDRGTDGGRLDHR